jgi:hypothetical protein
MALDAFPGEGPLPGQLAAAAPRARVMARLFSLVALGAVVWGFAYAGTVAYHVLCDSFVAPIILSPDSDLVLQSKVNLGRVIAERQSVAARLEQNHAAIAAAEAATDRLENLRAEASRALEWSRTLTDSQTSVGASELDGLGQQKVEVDQMTAKQEAYVAELRKDLAAGLVHQSEVTREESALGELRIARLQNQRDRFKAEADLRTASLAQESMRAVGRRGRLATPEMMAQRDQVVRIELELLKLKADLQGKVAQARVDEQELAKADELIAQMKARPIFRAIEASQNVAFVPYSQIDGVRAGGDVYRCSVWGIFACQPVGTVAEVLPGEVATQDPWGAPARGQYLLLALFDPGAAQAKTLRVRQRDGAAPPVAPPQAPAPPADGQGTALSRR